MKPEEEALLATLASIPLSPSTPCSYFDDRLSRARAFRITGDVEPELLESALSTGYRRCGDVYYQQHCKDCRMCISYRVPVASFQCSRSQRRVAKRNQDVTSRFVLPKPTAEKERIYLRYQQHQHGRLGETGEGGDSCLETMYFQMYTNPSSTLELELRVDEQLIGFGTLDVAIESVSAVYFVFDPEFRQRSLGTLAILRGIDWAREREYRYYHMGFLIPGHPKMDYKRNFLPGQYLNRVLDCWEDEMSEAAHYAGPSASD